MLRRFVVLSVLGSAVLLGGTRVPGAGEDLFNAAVLHRVDLNLHTADWAKLKQNFRTNDYYPADMTFNGATVYNVGIRSRGVASRSGTKPALRVDFDRYQDDQTFLGLKSVVLDNLLQDPSGIHETVTMWLFRKLGIPAPRESHTVLYVNGEYSGLYAIVESIDKTFLARIFDRDGDDVLNDGYLFEFDKPQTWNFEYLGPDLNAYKRFFDPKTHKNAPDEELFRPIETIVRLANEKPASELEAALGPLLDLRGFARFIAAQNFVAEQDGFIGEFGVNNFYLYRLEHSQQHVFIAWDDDLTFTTPEFALETRLGQNPLVSKLMQIPGYRAVYLATLQEAADLSDAREGGAQIGALELEIRRQLDLTYEALYADRFRPWSEGEVTTYVDLMKHFPSFRIRYVSCEVARLTGGPRCRPFDIRADLRHIGGVSRPI
jgi:hypothetical protein